MIRERYNRYGLHIIDYKPNVNSNLTPVNFLPSGYTRHQIVTNFVRYIVLENTAIERYVVYFNSFLNDTDVTVTNVSVDFQLDSKLGISFILSYNISNDVTDTQLQAIANIISNILLSLGFRDVKLLKFIDKRINIFHYGVEIID